MLHFYETMLFYVAFLKISIKRVRRKVACVYLGESIDLSQATRSQRDEL